MVAVNVGGDSPLLVVCAENMLAFSEVDGLSPLAIISLENVVGSSEAVRTSMLVGGAPEENVDTPGDDADTPSSLERASVEVVGGSAVVVRATLAVLSVVGASEVDGVGATEIVRAPLPMIVASEAEPSAELPWDALPIVPSDMEADSSAKDVDGSMVVAGASLLNSKVVECASLAVVG